MREKEREMAVKYFRIGVKKSEMDTRTQDFQVNVNIGNNSRRIESMKRAMFIVEAHHMII